MVHEVLDLREQVCGRMRGVCALLYSMLHCTAVSISTLPGQSCNTSIGPYWLATCLLAMRMANLLAKGHFPLDMLKT